MNSSNKDVIYAKGITLNDLLLDVQKNVILGFNLELEEGKSPYHIYEDKYSVKMVKDLFDVEEP